jgi:hypothetical protein
MHKTTSPNSHIQSFTCLHIRHKYKQRDEISEKFEEREILVYIIRTKCFKCHMQNIDLKRQP